jgi:predicted DNA-binding transcriptional regulator YafY
MVTKRLCRALRLLILLRQSEGSSLREIAVSLNCSHRTAADDLRLLSESGFDVVWTSGGYRIVVPDELPRGTAERKELLSLLEAIDASPFLRSLPGGTSPGPGSGPGSARVEWGEVHRQR